MDLVAYSLWINDCDESLMGTKVTLGGIVLVILYFVIPKLYRKWKRFSVASKSLSIAICCAVLLLGCYLLPFTTTYQNMVIQAEFFQVDRIFSLDFINRVLFNDRLSFFSNQLERVFYLRIQSNGFSELVLIPHIS